MHWQLHLIYLGKILLASFLGCIVGYERDKHDKPAGMRDAGLVTLGATIFTTIALDLAKISSQFTAPVRYDMGRIIAYVIVSIGFLGSGVIIYNYRKKKKLTGITTAAVLWTMVSVGILIGLNYFGYAIMTTALIYLLLKLKLFKVKIQALHNGEENGNS